MQDYLKPFQAWTRAVVSGCFLVLRSACPLRLSFPTPLVSGFLPPAFSFQGFSLSAFCLVLVAGLFDAVFHPQPVEQRALGLLLAGGGFDQVPNETGCDRPPASGGELGQEFWLERLAQKASKGSCAEPLP